MALAVHADAGMAVHKDGMEHDNRDAGSNGRRAEGGGRTSSAAAAATVEMTAAEDRPTGGAVVEDPRQARRGWGFICRSFLLGWGTLLAKQHRLSYVFTRTFCGCSKVGHIHSGRFKG